MIVRFNEIYGLTRDSPTKNSNRGLISRAEKQTTLIG